MRVTGLLIGNTADREEAEAEKAAQQLILCNFDRGFQERCSYLKSILWGWQFELCDGGNPNVCEIGAIFLWFCRRSTETLPVWSPIKQIFSLSLRILMFIRPGRQWVFVQMKRNLSQIVTLSPTRNRASAALGGGGREAPQHQKSTAPTMRQKPSPTEDRGCPSSWQSIITSAGKALSLQFAARALLPLPWVWAWCFCCTNSGLIKQARAS